ncbi:hypothetical protein EAL2_c19580 [Peptoclostridium acidaminophilum DSM 3953]|uniref:Uncharacterized protein n=1 Tax=Peptoclostridium acidaminophilum DSM 3953 TaxID=1286171 RepID=W8T672_PEPAC|nr:hypothetical protein EAL2_c19580 [Peptoclostridium acidaminophilum DSM 3953]
MSLINKLVIDILKPLGVPVGFQKYTGTAQTYITFHEYLQSGEEFEEDTEAFTGHYVQVDVWSKTDYTALVKNIKALLIIAGFKRLDEVDLYESDTGLYHKGIRLFYLESKEVD